MALQIAYTDPASKLRLAKATVVVKEVRVNYDAAEVHIILGIWSNPSAREGAAREIALRSLFTDPAALAKFVGKKDGGDLRPPVYRWLKHRTPNGDEIDFRKAVMV